MGLPISELCYMLFKNVSVVLNANYQLEHFEFDHTDGELLLELDLLICNDAIIFFYHHVHNVVCISDTAGGGFSPCIS
jgi:hypothetical protein